MIKDKLTEAFADVSNELSRDINDLRFSGSTCTSILAYGNKVWCANVGDSRTLLIRQDPKNLDGCQVRALSRDHKPDDPYEAERIRLSNGRIEAYKDERGNKIGPLRVWLPRDDVPGLAMTRSFGDATAA